MFETSHKPTPYRKHLWEFKLRRKLIRNSANTAKVDLSSQFSLFETSYKPTPYRKHLWEFKWRRKLIRNSANTAKVNLSSQFSLFETSHKPTPYRKHLWEFKWIRKLIRNSANLYIYIYWSITDIFSDKDTDPHIDPVISASRFFGRALIYIYTCITQLVTTCKYGAPCAHSNQESRIWILIYALKESLF